MSRAERELETAVKKIFEKVLQKRLTNKKKYGII